MAAGCVAFVRGPRRVGGDQVNRRRFDDEFLRGELNQRRLQPLAQLRLAGEDRDRAVRIDADPGIEHWLAFETAWQRRFGDRLNPGILRALGR
jgi:hypothetical protein